MKRSALASSRNPDSPPKPRNPEVRISPLRYSSEPNRRCERSRVSNEATGGHGVPGVGLIPGLLGDVPLLPWLVLPGVDGFELDDPEFGVDPGVEFVAPGRVPQGEPLGEL